MSSEMQTQIETQKGYVYRSIADVHEEMATKSHLEKF